MCHSTNLYIVAKIHKKHTQRERHNSEQRWWYLSLWNIKHISQEGITARAISQGCLVHSSFIRHYSRKQHVLYVTHIAKYLRKNKDLLRNLYPVPIMHFLLNKVMGSSAFIMGLHPIKFYSKLTYWNDLTLSFSFISMGLLWILKL